MSTLDKGAPVDVQYINDLATTVDKLVAAANTSPYQQTSINNGLFDASGVRIMKTAETRIHVETKNIALATYTAGTVAEFSVALTNFASPPAVTATPVVINTTSKRPVISAHITSVTASSVNGYLYLHSEAATSGQTIGISISAIGVPSNSPGTAATNAQTDKFYRSPPIVNYGNG
jgi:hypothetical protein